MASEHKAHHAPKEMSLPLGWRLSLHVAGIGALLCITVVFSLLPFQYGRVEQDSIAEARIISEAVSAIYERLGDTEPHDQARRLLLRVARTPHIYLVNVSNKAGVVSYSTDSRELGKHYDVRQGVTREGDILQITHVVSQASSSVGNVTVFIDRNLMLADTHRLFAQIAIGIFLIIFILSFLVKGLMESLVSSRLGKLIHLIENAEQGSFLTRAEVDRYDEIGHLMTGFNQLLGVITQIEAGHLEKEHGLRNDQAQRNMLLKLEEALDQLQRSNDRLKRKVQAQDLLMEAAHRLGGTLKRETLVDRLLTLVREKLQWPRFAVFLHDNRSEKKVIRLAGFFGFPDEHLQINARLEIGEGIAGLVAQTGAPFLNGNLVEEKVGKLWQFHDSRHPPMIEDMGSVMAVPLVHKGDVIGLFVAIHGDSHAFDAEDKALLNALGAQVSMAIVNAELYETTLELATSDPLTGVLNRRAMMKQIGFELARAQRFGNSMAILLVDVDHFKSYNDRMGHVLGDVALKGIAQSLKENTRKVDSVARFGGEEFCVILPQTNAEGAAEVAQKLCAGIRGLKFRGAENQELGYLSVSIGIAIAYGKEADVDDENVVTAIIEAADLALYEAKRQGRDRYVLHSVLS